MIIKDQDGVKVLVRVYPKDLNGGTFIVPNEVVFIERGAFYECRESLTRIVMHPGITVIKSNTFAYCFALTSVVLSSNLTAIEHTAFALCMSLTHVIIPPGVRSIGRITFSHCCELTDIVIPSDITVLEERLFEGCRNLRNIRIPSSITAIGKDAFEDCVALTHITVDSDDEKEIDRIKELFPEHLRGFILSKSLYKLVAEVQQKAIEGFCSDYPELLGELYGSSINIKNSLSIISQFAEPRGLSEFKKALFTVPYPKTQDDLVDYEAKLQDLKRSHSTDSQRQKFITASKLDRYIRTLEKSYSNHFFARKVEPSEKIQKKYQTLLEILEKIICCLQEDVDMRLLLSDEDKELINDTWILNLIPPEIRDELEINEKDYSRIKEERVQQERMWAAYREKIRMKT